MVIRYVCTGTTRKALVQAQWQIAFEEYNKAKAFKIRHSHCICHIVEYFIYLPILKIPRGWMSFPNLLNYFQIRFFRVVLKLSYFKHLKKRQLYKNTKDSNSNLNVLKMLLQNLSFWCTTTCICNLSLDLCISN